MANPSIEQERRRGQELFLDEPAFEKIGPDTWIVEGIGLQPRVIELDDTTCDCAHFLLYGHNPKYKCKHIVACEYKDKWVRKNGRELAFVLESMESEAA